MVGLGNVSLTRKVGGGAGVSVSVGVRHGGLIAQSISIGCSAEGSVDLMMTMMIVE